MDRHPLQRKYTKVIGFLVLLGLMGTASAQPLESSPLIEIQWIPQNELTSAHLPEQAMMLPYRELLELLRNAGELGQNKADLEEAIVTSAKFRGRIGGGAAHLIGELTVRAESSEWSLLDMNLGTAKLRRFEISGRGVPILSTNPSRLTFPLRGPVEEKIELHLTQPLRSLDTDTSFLPLDLPRGAGSSVEIVLPPGAIPWVDGSDPLVQFQSPPDNTATEGVRARGYLPSEGPLRIAFRKSQARSDVEYPLDLVSNSRILVTEDSILNRVALTVTPPANAKSFTMRIPRETRIKHWSSPNLSRGRETLDEEAGARKIEFLIESPPILSFSLHLELESPLPPLPDRVVLPLPSLEGCVRQRGEVTLFLGEDLALHKEETQGLAWISCQRLRPGTATQSGPQPIRLALHYRVTAPLPSMSFDLRNREPMFDTVSDTTFRLEPRRILAQTRLVLRPRIAPLYRVLVPLTGGAVVRDLRTTDPEQTLDWKLERSGSETLLILELTPPIAPVPDPGTQGERVAPRRAKPVPVILEIEKPWESPPSTISLSPILPRGARSALGRLVVETEIGIRATETSSNDLVRVLPDPSSSLPKNRSSSLPKNDGSRQDYEFQRNSAKLELALSIESPRLSARLHVLHIPTQQTLRTVVDADLRIDRADEDHFRFRLPPESAHHLDVEVLSPPGLKIKEKAREGNSSFWSVSLQEKIRGPLLLRLSFLRSLPLSSAGSGSTVEVMPSIHVGKALTEEGFVAVAAADKVEVESSVRGLRDLDLLEMPLPRGHEQTSLLYAYRYSIPGYGLSLKLRSYPSGSVASCLIEDATHAVSLTPTGTLRGQWILQVKNAGRQTIEVDLPQGSVHWSTLVDGHPVKALRSPRGSLLIPVSISLSPEQRIEVEITYENRTEALDSSGRLELGHPRVDVPVLTSRAVFDLPAEYQYSDISGNHSEFAARSKTPPLLAQLLGGTRTLGFGADKSRPTGKTTTASSRSASALPSQQSDPDTTAISQLENLGYVEDSKGAEVLEEEESEAPEEKRSETRGRRVGDERSDKETSKSRTPAPPRSLGQRDGRVAQVPGRGRRSGILPLELSLPHGGAIVRIHGFGDGGTTSIDYVRRDLLETRDLLFFLLAAVGCWWIARRGWLPVKGQVLLLWPALLFGPYLVENGEWTRVFNSLFLGSAMIFALGIGTWLVKGLRNRLYLHHPDELRRQVSRASTAILALTVLACSSAVAQRTEEPPPGESKSLPSEARRKIVIPYDPAKGVPTTESTSPTFLPLDWYRSLYEKAYPEIVQGEIPPGFPRSLLIQSEYEGQVSAERVRLTARFQAHLFDDGPFQLPLQLGEATLVGAQIDEETGGVFRAPDRGFVANVRGRGHHEIRLELLLPLGSFQEARSASLSLAPCPGSSLRLSVPKELASSFQLHPSPSASNDEEDGVEILEVALPLIDRIDFSLPPGRSRKPEETFPISISNQVVVTPDSSQLTFILGLGETEGDSGNQRRQTSLPSRLELELSPGLVLQRGARPGVLNETLIEREERRFLVLEFDPKTASPQRITLHGFQTDDGSEFDVPTLRPRGGTLTRGRLSINSATGSTFSIASTRGLVRTTVGTGSKNLRPRDVPEAAHFEIKNRDFSCRVRMAPEPVPSVAVDQLLECSRDRIDLLARIDFESPSTNPLSSFAIPRGFSLVEVLGPAVRDFWVDSEVPSDRSDEVQADVLWVRQSFLNRRVPDPISVFLVREGPTFDLEHPLPFLLPRDCESIQGRVRILSQNDVGVSLTLAGGASDIEPTLMAPTLTSLHKQFELRRLTPLGVDRRAVSFRGPPLSRLTLREIQAEIHARATANVVVGEGFLDVDTGIRYTFARGASDHVHLSVPETAFELLEIKGARVLGFREMRRRKGSVLVRVDLRAPEREAVNIVASVRLGWVAGEKTSVPCIVPEKVARREGLVTITRATREELFVDDPQGLFLDPDGSRAGRQLYRWLAPEKGPWQLTVRLEPIRAAEMLEAAVTSMTLSTSSLDRMGRGGGSLMTKVELVLSNRAEQYLELRLPQDAELWSTLVDDRPVKPILPQLENGDSGAGSLIGMPLRKSSPGETASIVRLVYVQNYSRALHRVGSIRPGAPSVMNMPVSQTYWKFLLPEGCSLEFDGNMERISEAVAAVDRLEALIEQQLALEEVAQTGTEAQRALANQNLAINSLDIQEGRRQADRAQRLLLEQTADLSRLAQEERSFETQARSNRQRLAELDQRLKKSPNFEAPFSTRVPTEMESAPRQQAQDSVRKNDAPEPMDEQDLLLREKLEKTAPSRARAENERARGLVGEKESSPRLGRASEAGSSLSGSGTSASAASSTEAGLLSLKIELPKGAQEFLYKKLEGDPEVVLEIEYDPPSSSILGWIPVMFFLILALAVGRIRAQSLS